MSAPHRPHRPFIVTLLVLGVFFLGIWNAGKALAIARESRLMLALNVTLDPRIRIGIAFLWAVIFGGVAVAMWWKRPFTQRAIPTLLAVYALTELTQQQLFAQNIDLQTFWQTAIFYLIIVVVMWWGLKRPSVKKHFGDRYTKQ